MARVRPGSNVVAKIGSGHSEILEYMGLQDADGNDLENIEMTGRVLRKTGQNWLVWLTATMKAHFFNANHADLLRVRPEGLSIPTYFCVVDKEIQDIDGLILPEGCKPEGYHIVRSQAELELQGPGKTVSASAASSTNTYDYDNNSRFQRCNHSSKKCNHSSKRFNHSGHCCCENKSAAHHRSRCKC